MANNIYAGLSSSFWEEYFKGRPHTPQSFWDRIFEYHAEHSGKYHAAFDLGAGVGVHSPYLGARFRRVVLGDPSPANLEIAKKALSPAADGGGDAAPRYEFSTCTAENSALPDGSLDMVYIANSFHWMRPREALENIARQLRPGGTLVLALFAVAYFDDGAVRDAYGRMLTHGMAVSRELFRDKRVMDYGLATELVDSGYDAAALPADLFEPGALRLKLNVAGRDAPFTMDRSGAAPAVSRVGDTDRLVELEDPDWAFDMGLDEVKANFASFPFRSLDEGLISKGWEELAAVVQDGRYKGSWPVSLVLATRK